MGQSADREKGGSSPHAVGLGPYPATRELAGSYGVTWGGKVIVRSELVPGYFAAKLADFPGHGHGNPGHTRGYHLIWGSLYLDYRPTGGVGSVSRPEELALPHVRLVNDPPGPSGHSGGREGVLGHCTGSCSCRQREQCCPGVRIRGVPYHLYRVTESGPDKRLCCGCPAPRQTRQFHWSIVPPFGSVFGGTGSGGGPWAVAYPTGLGSRDAEESEWAFRPIRCVFSYAFAEPPEPTTGGNP